jgi:hypothetical protein
MDANNRPEDNCAFCLSPMMAAGGGGAQRGGADAAPLARLRCFHAFHAPCFVSRWGARPGGPGKFEAKQWILRPSSGF